MYDVFICMYVHIYIYVYFSSLLHWAPNYGSAAPESLVYGGRSSRPQSSEVLVWLLPPLCNSCIMCTGYDCISDYIYIYMCVYIYMIMCSVISIYIYIYISLNMTPDIDCYRLGRGSTQGLGYSSWVADVLHFRAKVEPWTRRWNCLTV